MALQRSTYAESNHRCALGVADADDTCDLLRRQGESHRICWLGLGVRNVPSVLFTHCFRCGQPLAEQSLELPERPLSAGYGCVQVGDHIDGPNTIRPPY